MDIFKYLNYSRLFTHVSSYFQLMLKNLMILKYFKMTLSLKNIRYCLEFNPVFSKPEYYFKIFFYVYLTDLKIVELTWTLSRLTHAFACAHCQRHKVSWAFLIVSFRVSFDTAMYIRQHCFHIKCYKNLCSFQQRFKFLYFP